MSMPRTGLGGRRGGGLVSLLAVVALWSAMRMLTWAPPFEPASLQVLPLADSSAQPQESAVPEPVQPGSEPLFDEFPNRIEPFVPERIVPPVPHRVSPDAKLQPAGVRWQGGPSGTSRAFAGVGGLIDHVLLLQAGYRASAAIPDQVPPLYADSALAAAPRSASTAPRAAAEMRRTPAPSRWSMDAWALWREESDSPLLSGRPSYGRSQLGAVLRFDLAPSSGHRPQVHLRGSAALEGQREREVAFGASARPLPSIPVRLAAEARVSETVGGTELRGAAYAVSELPPVTLPAGFSAEAYIQAGYVTGDFATPFVDGQARITRPLANVDDFRLEAAAGAWGGAQEDAGRLDIGPSAAVTFRLGETRGRLSADYRFRVAGDAEPSSGPAITLSAGF